MVDITYDPSMDTYQIKVPQTLYVITSQSITESYDLDSMLHYIAKKMSDGLEKTVYNALSDKFGDKILSKQEVACEYSNIVKDNGTLVVDKLDKAFPGVLHKNVSAPKHKCFYIEEGTSCPANPGSISLIIQHLNDQAKWTFDEIADWLETLDIDMTIKD